MSAKEWKLIHRQAKKTTKQLHSALRSHHSKKAVAFWICVQQQQEPRARPELNRPSGEIFWADVMQDFPDKQFWCHFHMHDVSLEVLVIAG